MQSTTGQPKRPAAHDVAGQLDLAGVADQLDLSGIADQLDLSGIDDKPKDSRSMFARVYDAAFTAPKVIRDFGNSMEETMLASAARGEPGAGLASRAAGFAAGTMDALLTPGDLILALTGMKAVRDGGRGVGAVARGVDALGSGALVARGAERSIDADDAGDVGAGSVQALLGMAGMAGARANAPAVPRPTVRGRLVAAPHAVTPDGVVLPPGASVPPAARNVTPSAPAGRSARPAAVMGRSASGDRVYSSDPNAQPVALEPAALLPERAATLDEFVPTPGGTSIARKRDLIDADSVARQLDVSGIADAAPPQAQKAGKAPKAPKESSAVPAPVMDFHADGRKVFSSDAAAASVRNAPLDNDELGEVRRMYAEMDAMPFTRHTFDHSPSGQGGTPDIIGGAGGAKVYEDIVELYGGTGPGREAIADAMDKLLKGERSVYGPAIRETARLRLKGQLRGQLPPDAGDLAQSGSMTDDDYAEFARMVDREAADVAGDASRLTGEDGRINPALLQHLSGAAVGAAAGGATGDDMESRIKNAAVGGVMGAMVPSVVGGRPARFRLAPPVSGVTLDPRVSGLAPEPRPVQRPALDASGRFLAESGSAHSGLLTNMGGAAGGAALGASAGSTPEEKIKGALFGGAIGLAGANSLPGGVLRGRIRVPEKPAPMVGRLTTRANLQTTGRPAPRPETARQDPMAGTEAFLGKFAPEIKSGITEVLERNGGFDAQRRGVMNQAQVERLAQGIAVDVQRTLKPGTALNAEAIRSHVDALATAQSKVNDLAAKVARGANSDADVLALQAAKAEVDTIGASVMGARSEAGRALAQWRMLARVLDTGNPDLMADAARLLRGEAAEFAGAFSKLPDDPLQRFRWLQQHGKPSRMEQVRQYYLSNILSGLKTHERNAIGNAANSLTNLVVHPAAVGVDAVRSAVTGAPRTAFLSELPSQMAGGLLGFERGISEALFSLKNGVNRSALTQSLSAAEAGKLDVPRVEFGGGGANPLNWPGRALDASDQFFRAIARNTEAHGLAHAQAKREGLSGDRLTERMGELLAGAGKDGERIAEQADAFARRTVFQEKAGPLVGNIQAIAQRYPAVSFVLPFVRTPSNILRQGFEFSPAGFGMKAARAGGREGAQAQARAALGSVGVAGLAWLASTGRLSGNGPTDQIERAQLMESGWRPNSVRVGDRWVGISLFQPISVPAMAIANSFESWQSRGMREADAPTKALEAMRGFGQSVLDLSFMSGVADLFAALSREGSAGSRGAEYAGRVASGFVPLAGAQRTAAHAMDTTVRDADGFSEQIMTGIPGLSNNVPARMDRFGRDVKRQGGAFNVVDPFNVSTISDDPVLAEVGRVRMGRASGKVSGAELSRDEEREIQKLKGTATYEVLARAVASDGYQALDDMDKAAVLERLIDQTRAQVQKGLRGRFRLREPLQQGAR